jgi:hypothetical protein
MQNSQEREYWAKTTKENFKDHVIKNTLSCPEKEIYHFHCHRPSTGMYSYNVIFTPGTVIITGDIGDAIFSHSDRQSLSWCLSSVDSMDYVLGKMQESKKAYYPDLARQVYEEWYEERIAYFREEEPEGLDSFLDDVPTPNDIEWGYEHEATRDVYEAVEDCDILTSFYYWSSNALSCYFGLKNFVRLWKEYDRRKK